MRSKLKLIFLFILTVVFGVLITLTSSAEEYKVGSGDDCDFSTVNDAFDSASDGDTIIITETIGSSGNTLNFGKSITYILDGGVTWTAGASCSATGKDVVILARNGNASFKPSSSMWCNSYNLTVNDLTSTSWSFGSLDGSILSVDLSLACIRLTYGVTFKEINLLPNSEIINVNNTEVRDTQYFVCTTFNMYEDSKIYGNYVQAYRGLIRATTLNIYGGEIYGNYNGEYGIAIVDTVNMYGGRVYNNYCSFTNSTAIEGLFENSTLNMYGGEICNNYIKGTTTEKHSVLYGAKHIIDGSIHDNYYFTSWTTPTKENDVYSIPNLDLSNGTEMGNGLGSTTVYEYSVIFKEASSSIISAYLVNGDTIKSTVSGATSISVPEGYAWVLSAEQDCSYFVTPDLSSSGAYYGVNHDITDTVAIAYPNGFTKNGEKGYSCSNVSCSYIEVTETLVPIFTPNGYSYNSDKTAFNGGYSVNKDALDAYNALNDDISFGIIIVNPAYLGDSFFDSNNKLTATEKSIQVEILSSDYSNFNFSINGFTNNTIKALELVVASYAISGDTIEFIQAEYDLTSTPAVSKVEKSDATLYTVSLNTVVNRNSIEQIPVYSVPSTKEEE